MRAAYLTSGPSRGLKLGAHIVGFDMHQFGTDLSWRGGGQGGVGTGSTGTGKSRESNPETARQAATVRAERTRVGSHACRLG